MAKIKVGSSVFAVNDIKVWPTDEDDLTTSRGWEVYMKWLNHTFISKKKHPKDKNSLWCSSEKIVVDDFDFDLVTAISWGMNSKYLFVDFTKIGKPNKKYIGFIVGREHIITQSLFEDDILKYEKH